MPHTRVFFETSLICGSFYVLNSQAFAELDCAPSASQTVPTLLQSLQREHDKSDFRNIGLDSELQEALQFEFQSNISAIAKPFHDPQNGSSDLSLPLPSNESATSFTSTGVRTVANVPKPKRHIRRGTTRKRRQKKHSRAISKLSEEAENDEPIGPKISILEARKQKEKKGDVNFLKAKASGCLLIIILAFAVQLIIFLVYLKDDAVDQKQETITIADLNLYGSTSDRRNTSGNRRSHTCFASWPPAPPVPPEETAVKKVHHWFWSFGNDLKSWCNFDVPA